MPRYRAAALPPWPGSSLAELPLGGPQAFRPLGWLRQHSTPVLVVAFVLLALLLAPESPADQEAICQRHNGAAACRVW
ncbi:MAG: hypothetical protein ACOVNL_12410 [Prochlorococcaceae cyanobacterium]|jgi:hypothetical protein